MLLNQTLLLLSALSLHSGFGFFLGSLWRRSRQKDHVLQWAALSLVFFFLVYLPSCLVVLGLNELHSALRFLTLMLGWITIALPFLRSGRAATLLGSQALQKFYIATSMLLLASWSTTIVVHDGIASGAPLALTSALAGIAVMQNKSEAR